MTDPFDQAAEEHFTPPEWPNAYFEAWKYHIGCAENQKGERLTEDQLRKWAEDPNRMMECLFCQTVEPPNHFQVEMPYDVDLNTLEKIPTKWHITACPQCREYKGILPHIPGWSDLE